MRLPPQLQAPVSRIRESRFLAGRGGLFRDLATAVRMLWELYRAFRRFDALGPCILVIGQNPSGLGSTQAALACESMGSWLASQGFTVVTLGEQGLTERLARSSERVGGRVLRCPLSDTDLSPGPGQFTFRYELARRLAVA